MHPRSGGRAGAGVGVQQVQQVPGPPPPSHAGVAASYQHQHAQHARSDVHHEYAGHTGQHYTTSAANYYHHHPPPPHQDVIEPAANPPRPASASPYILTTTPQHHHATLQSHLPPQPSPGHAQQARYALSQPPQPQQQTAMPIASPHQAPRSVEYVVDNGMMIDADGRVYMQQQQQQQQPRQIMLNQPQQTMPTEQPSSSASLQRQPAHHMQPQQQQGHFTRQQPLQPQPPQQLNKIPQPAYRSLEPHEMGRQVVQRQMPLQQQQQAPQPQPREPPAQQQYTQQPQHYVDAAVNDDARNLFHAFVLDYLTRSGYYSAAHYFLRDVPDTPVKPLAPGQVHPASSQQGRNEGDLVDGRSLPTPSVPLESPNGFLFEWWALFWDMFRSRPRGQQSFVDATRDAADAAIRSTAQFQQQRGTFGGPRPMPPQQPLYRNGQAPVESQYRQGMLMRQPSGGPIPLSVAARPPAQPQTQQQILRAQEAAVAAAQHAQAVRAANNKPQARQAVRATVSPLPPPQASQPPPHPPAQAEAPVSARQQRAWQAQQEVLARQHHQATQAQAGIRSQTQQQMQHAQQVAIAHIATAKQTNANNAGGNTMSAASPQRAPPQLQIQTSQPPPQIQHLALTPSTLGSPYDIVPTSPTKRFMNQGGFGEPAGSSPYQTLASPSQATDYRSPLANQVLSTDQHMRMASNQPQMQAASSPIYLPAGQALYSGVAPTSRPPSVAMTPSQIHPSLPAQNPQAAPEGSMPPPTPTGGTANRQLPPHPGTGQATGGATSTNGTPQGQSTAATPGTVMLSEVESPANGRGPTPRGGGSFPPTPKQANTSLTTASPSAQTTSLPAAATTSAAAAANKRKRDTAEPRETKKRGTARQRAASDASQRQQAPTPSETTTAPAVANGITTTASETASDPVQLSITAQTTSDEPGVSNTGNEFASSYEGGRLSAIQLDEDASAYTLIAPPPRSAQAASFAGVNLDPRHHLHDDDFHSHRHHQQDGVLVNDLDTGFMSQEQVDAMFSGSMALNSAQPDTGSFDFDAMFSAFGNAASNGDEVGGGGDHVESNGVSGVAVEGTNGLGLDGSTFDLTV
ncbi:hypothetical protein ACM66B_006147 [Microbotryomycetes sp. NB124-2]